MAAITITLLPGVCTVLIDSDVCERTNRVMNKKIDGVPGVRSKTLADIDTETLRRLLTRRVKQQHTVSFSVFGTAYTDLLEFAISVLPRTLAVLPTTTPLRSFLRVLFLFWFGTTVTFMGAPTPGIAACLGLMENTSNSLWWSITNSYIESVSGLEVGY